MSVCVLCLCSTHGVLEKGIRSPRTGVTDGCKLTCECWNCCLEPLEDQPVFLTAELLLQPP
ncbi:hypothetical protein I79_019941 [Cricetulus griseus]|uniref:Uncharacterized protein n=1 Tax=Cricetulus griseus TaxID=10029 RepID=G3I8R4_CRIGR|nr:hypothetical protein I79_019941 [Cricetulus griseus]